MDEYRGYIVADAAARVQDAEAEAAKAQAELKAAAEALRFIRAQHDRLMNRKHDAHQALQAATRWRACLDGPRADEALQNILTEDWKRADVSMGTYSGFPAEKLPERPIEWDEAA